MSESIGEEVKREIEQIKKGLKNAISKGIDFMMYVWIGVWVIMCIGVVAFIHYVLN